MNQRRGYLFWILCNCGENKQTHFRISSYSWRENKHFWFWLLSHWW